MDAILSLREWLLSSLSPGGAVVSVAEVNRRDEQPDVVVNLATVIAETGMNVDLILAEYSDHIIDGVLSALSVIERRREDVYTEYSCPRIDRLNIVVPSLLARSNGRAADAVTKLLRSERHGARMTVIAISPKASGSLQLAAGRSADALVMLCTRKTTRSRQVVELVAAMRAAGASPVRGSVILPRGRRCVLPRSQDEATERVSEGEAALRIASE
jgi:hypothetical protein